MGRPTKLNANVQRVIVSAISKGNTREVAAAAAGIHRATLFNWLAAGEKAKRGQYFDFLDAVKRAEAGAIVAMVGVVRHAGAQSWQAAAWWLERRYPDEWGRKDRVTLEHLLSQEVERMAGELGLSKEDILADAERILARSG